MIYIIIKLELFQNVFTFEEDNFLVVRLSFPPSKFRTKTIKQRMVLNGQFLDFIDN